MSSGDSSGSIRALITTIQPIDGGVPSMTKWICRLLEEYNIVSSLAWYAPFRNYPSLSVPLYQMGRNRPGTIKELALDKYPSYGLGAWYPEFEFTHYLPRQAWKELIRQNDLHFVVSGNTLAATPYVFFKVPFVSWIATPWEADRENRIRTFSKQRRLLDSIVNKPVLRFLEKKILRSQHASVLALSSYTSSELKKISSRNVSDVMIMPIDEEIFKRDTSKTKPWRIGFSGRYCDPRKNIDLLLAAASIVLSYNKSLEIVLVGDKDSSKIEYKIKEYGLEACVTCYQHMNSRDLSLLLQSFDAFVIPSFQEGLCISALEAMACGVPIISTYCGGPEEYVRPFQTGLLIDYSPDTLAEAIIRICSDRIFRDNLANGCCKWIKENASQDRSREIFRKHLYGLITKNNLLHLVQKANI
jgi:glycosyltransferase involved in cell wall biosynthesis